MLTFCAIIDIMEAGNHRRSQLLGGIISLFVVALYLGLQANSGFMSYISRMYSEFASVETTASQQGPHTLNVTKKVLPHCIIAGVAKCGTRALLDFLQLHTHVSTAAKEVHFFNKDWAYKKGLSWYKQHMKPSYSNQLTLEKTPLYFTNVNAPGRIHRMNSTIKLIFTVREPVTRMISHYVQRELDIAVQGKNKQQSFEKEVTDYRTGRVKPSSILTPSLYDIHMKRWIKYFNRSQIHIVDGDAFIENPVPALAKIEAFLGIEHQLNDKLFYYNTERGYYCVKNVSTFSGCLNPKIKGLPHPNVAQKIMEKLCEYFQPHNEAFYKLAGHYYNWDCPNGTARK